MMSLQKQQFLNSQTLKYQQDLAHSNSNMCSLLSTIEAIYLKETIQDAKNRAFGYYDSFDFFKKKTIR